ncbi:MAG: four helix bundle protein [Bacteroidales bacterium]|nr:four helix bundle protein [Bacteroidales bacterium]
MENVNQDTDNGFFRFEDLRIYAKAIEYSKWLLTTLPEPAGEQQRNLAQSFCHSAYDIALNIAEGSSRNKSQFEHYLKISKTAIRECVVYTAMALGIGMIDEEQSRRSRELLMEMTRMVGACIISLQRGSHRSGSVQDDAVDTDSDSDFDN